MKTLDDLIESLGDFYDIDALEFDYTNNNFDLETGNVNDYYAPQIVADSVINGQIKQARNQYNRFNLSPSQMEYLLSKHDLAKLTD